MPSSTVASVRPASGSTASVRPSSGVVASRGISAGDLINAPTALDATSAFVGAGLGFLEAMDTAGWNFATAGPLRDALIAYVADAQAELVVMISGAAGAQHDNAAAYQGG